MWVAVLLFKRLQEHMFLFKLRAILFHVEHLIAIHIPPKGWIWMAIDPGEKIERRTIHK